MGHRKPFPEDISIYLQLPTEQAHIPRGTLIIGLVLFLSYQSSPDLFKKQEGLNNYIVKSKILFSSQHGLESEHWIFILLLNIYDKQAAMDNNEYSIGRFLDLRLEVSKIDWNVDYWPIVHWYIYT